MLAHLSIQNYALIDVIEIDFYAGYTAITGETGAGKSIILDALSLILGQRADIQALPDTNRKCIIEGTFHIKNYGLQHFFEAYNLDYDDTLILRREINPEGKSRAFVNDTPVSLAQMKELGERLVDLHSQHQTRLINDERFQMLAIDSYANISGQVKVHAGLFAHYRDMKKELQRLIDHEKQAKADADYYNFLFNELENALLKENEQQPLEQELEKLNHVEQIKSTVSKAVYSLSNSENSINQQLNSVYNLLIQVAKFDSSLEENIRRLQSACIELKDISSEMEQIEEKIQYSPERFELVSQRLNEIYRLQQKHHVNTIDELLAIKHELDQKLQNISSLEKNISKMESLISQCEKDLMVSAQKISMARKKVFKEIEQKVVEIIQQLGMPNARVAIAHQLLPAVSEDGLDEIKFTFSANKGSELKEISRIASGGELSRLMLALKSIISRKKLLPTIIFDEIDSGVSGEVASKTGAIMKELSKDMQVISITHLPQIAGKSDFHYLVYKKEEKNTTFTRLKLLQPDERVEVLAEMLSGSNVSEAARKTARQLLG
ncbi:MAG TPA: DNA repair protein RecN [Bacteroidales bacterium]|nr:DNA repair protein RecN [Bacteroidales bacterium]HPS27534.1 DNA repair protein RecN [Bacteroidales bacterium]